MQYFKRALLSVLLIVALLVATVPVFAEGAAATNANPSVTGKKLSYVVIASTTYNAKKQLPKVKVYDEDNKLVASKFYKVSIDRYPKKAGTYDVTVSGKGVYTGSSVTGEYVINKAYNPFRIKIARTKFPQRDYRNSIVRIRAKNVKEKANLSEWKSTKKKVVVKNGWVVIQRGFYGTAKISITAAETGNYLETTQSVKITVIQKK